MSESNVFDVELTIDELVLARQALRLFAHNAAMQHLCDLQNAVALANRLGAIASGSAARAR